MSGWQFDTVNSGQKVGWYPPGLTTFRDDQLKNLVREILQNSLDNPARKSQREPVVVEFEMLELQRSEIPAIDDLQTHISDCLKDKDSISPEDLEDIRYALRVAKQKSFSVLKISDHNTSGMSGGAIVGDCVDGSAFFNYIKTEGESGGNQGRGGSHGLGKNAPLVGSRVRSIFASTRFTQSGESHALIQGRCQLRTRVDGSDRRLAPTGFWGGDDFAPLTEVPEQYGWLERDSQGTSISIVGWSGEKNWQQLVVCYAITNFFAAFKRKKLRLVVGNFTVDHENLMEYLSNNGLEKKFIAHDKANNEDAWQLAKWLVQCIDLKPDQDHFENDFQCPGEIGSGKLSLLVAEGAPKKLAFIRANILITSDIPYFWKRVPGSLKDFVGVYECSNEAGLTLLRRMEPPQHNGLNADFLPWVRQEEGKRNLENLSKKLKNLVERFAEVDFTDHHADNFTLEFFSDEAGDGGAIQDDEDINPEGALVIHIKPQNRPPPKPIQTEDDLNAQGETEDEGDEDGDAGGAGEGGGGNGGSDGHGPGEGDGTGGTGNRDILKVAIQNALTIAGERFIRSSEVGGNGKCFVQGFESKRIEVILIEVGTDTLSLIPATDIESCSGNIGEKGIVTSTDDSGAVNFDFTLRRKLLGGLKIVVNKVDL